MKSVSKLDPKVRGLMYDLSEQMEKKEIYSLTYNDGAYKTYVCRSKIRRK